MRRMSGFTLIELMLVLMIIGIMLLILVPSIPAVTAQIKAHQTETLMASVDLGIHEYKSKYGTFPPTTVLDSKHGWAPSDQNTSAFALSYYLQGPTGSGWRTSDHGVTADFGPHIESLRSNVMDMPFGYQQPTKPVITDAFNSPILYIKANMQYPANFDDKYNKNRYSGWALRAIWGGQRNTSDGENMYNTYGNHFVAKMTKAQSGGHRYPYNPTTFIMWSAGPNRLFGYWKWREEGGGWDRDDSYSNSDDITNFN